MTSEVALFNGEGRMLSSIQFEDSLFSYKATWLWYLIPLLSRLVRLVSNLRKKTQIPATWEDENALGAVERTTRLKTVNTTKHQAAGNPEERLTLGIGNPATKYPRAIPGPNEEIILENGFQGVHLMQGGMDG